jgi:hypothetical protein
MQFTSKTCRLALDLILSDYGTSLDHSRIAPRMEHTEDENAVVIDEVKYPIGESLRKRSADFFVDLLMGLRVFLNAEKGGFYGAEKLLA